MFFRSIQEQEEYEHGREHPWQVASQFEWQMYRERNEETLAGCRREIEGALAAGLMCVVETIEVHGPFDEIMGSYRVLRGAFGTREEAENFVLGLADEDGSCDMLLAVLPEHRPEPAAPARSPASGADGRPDEFPF